MNPSPPKDQDVSKRLRHSDSAIERSRHRKQSPKKSPSKSVKNQPELTSSSLKKAPDVEHVKKRLRSAGDYKLSVTFDDPERPDKSISVQKSASNQKSDRKSTSNQKSSPTKKSPKKSLPKSTSPTRKSPEKQERLDKSSPPKNRSKREPFSPEQRTPSPINRSTRSTENNTQKPLPKTPSSSAKKTTKTTNSSSKKAPTSSTKKTAVQVKKEAEPEQTPRTVTSALRRPATIKVELPEMNVTPNLLKTPRSTNRFFEPDTPPVRNQNVFYNCVVCKEPTLLLTAEYQEKLLKNEVKKFELSAGELSSCEDPALQCNVCKKHFHMVCVFDEVQLQNWGVSNPKSFVCQECIRCSRCLEPIFDPGNVQCITCGHAYHEVCKPETQITHDFPSISRIWYCHTCEEKLLRVLDFKHRHDNATIGDSLPSTSKAAQQSPPKRPNKRKLNQVTESPKSKKASRPSTDLNKSIKSPANKKAKVEPDTSPSRALRRLTSRNNPEASSPSKPSPSKSSPKTSKTSPVKTESPSRVNRNKELTDEEQEKKRLATLERLKESIKYDGEYQCIAAQESIFSRLNEEYLDEEEELNEPKLEHYVPFASVGNSKRTDSTDLTFFYGTTAYRPRFTKFLRTVYPEYDRLSFCQKCLMAFTSPTDYLEHNSACAVKHPPGSLIYQEKNVSVWEVFGKKENTYCRRLAIFAKTFIGSKSVFFEVEQFNFYVLTENDSNGISVMAGYFSKEIKPTANNNLSCLLILPWLQRKGYGVFLIDLSYHLSLKERKIGSPEHPLSDAGLKTYRQYWYSAIMSFLREKIYNKEKIDLVELKEQKGIDLRDILETMIVADMTFILDNQLQINVETPMYTMLSLLRRRYVKPKLLQVKARAGPFTTYN